MSEIFPNAPLFEAVFQLRFSGEAAVEIARARIQEEVREELPKLYVPRAVPGESLALKPWEFRSDDDSEIVGLAINSFSYHSRKYAGFARFRERFTLFHSVFGQNVRVHRLNRIGLRYINQFPVLRQSDTATIPLKDYVNVGFDLPSSLANASLVGLNSTFSLRFDNGGSLRVLLQHKEVTEPSKTEILVLDFDFSQDKDLDVSRVMEYLDHAHAQTKRIFLDMVSERYMVVMRTAT